MAQTIDSDRFNEISSSADAVMDELFGDVEQSLHIEKVGAVPAKKTPTLELEDLGVMDDQNHPEDHLADQIAWLSPYSPPPSEAVPPPPPVPPRNWLTPILLGCACSSALLATILWSFHLSARLAEVNTPPPTPTPLAAATLDPQTTKFSNEIKELLAYSNPQTQPTLPAPLQQPLPPPLPQIPPQVPVPQTVYVPVYQTPVTALPPVTPDQNQSIDPNTPSPTVTPSIAPSHTLVGVLSFGDRATAMFELGGTVETISVGNPIGSTGWVLVKVQQRDVTVKRNNETKTILVGQKF